MGWSMDDGRSLTNIIFLWKICHISPRYEWWMVKLVMSLKSSFLWKIFHISPQCEWWGGQMAGWREGAAAPPRLSPPPPHPQRHCHRCQRCCHCHHHSYFPRHFYLWKSVLPVVNITSTILIRTSPPASWSPRAHWPSFSRTAMCTQNEHCTAMCTQNVHWLTRCTIARHTHLHHCMIGGSF